MSNIPLAKSAAIFVGTMCLYVICCSCSKSEPSSGRYEDTSHRVFPDSSNIKEQNRFHDSTPQPFQIEACSSLGYFEKSIDTVLANPQGIRLGNNDSCVIAYLDSLTERFIKNASNRYISALSVIYRVGDGYVAEYYDDIMIRLLDRAPEQTLDYICSENSGDKQSLRNALKSGIAASIAGYRDSAVLAKKTQDLFAKYNRNRAQSRGNQCVEQLWNDVIVNMREIGAD